MNHSLWRLAVCLTLAFPVAACGPLSESREDTAKSIPTSSTLPPPTVTPIQVNQNPAVQSPAATPLPATADTPTPPVNSPSPSPPAAEGTNPCPGPQPPLVTDFDVRQTPAQAEPAPRAPFRDPVFGTCLVRVTDRKADLSPDDASTGLKNEYSRAQSFNADGSHILARGIDGTWYLYDTQTLRPLGQPPLAVDPRWDASDPNRLYYSDETRLMSYNAQSGESSLAHDFAQDFPGQSLAAVWTRYEGSPSRDGRYWGLMAQNQDWQTVDLLVYDQQTDQVTARRDLPTPQEIDSVTISPLGNYFLAYNDNYCEPDQPGDDAHPCGLMVYDRDLKNGRSLLRIVGHSDLALDPAGREVLVYQDIDTDHIAMLDLASGAVTPLWPIDFSHTAIGLHFSGRAFNRPGWALVSTYNGGHPTAYTWLDDSVFAIELKAGGRVARLAHTHSLVDENQEHDYWAEPHASVNPDFTRVLFTSNWGRSGTGEVEMYMLSLPSNWPDALPAAAAAAPTTPAPDQSETSPPAVDKWSLWVDGPHLRGANIWQRIVVPSLDGPEILGSGHVGPPYTQEDFNQLAALGANYVNISHPGLFTEKPPYVLDEAVQANLDHLLDMITQADMFAVITFRTGPGRSDFTFYRDGAGDWFDKSLLIESVWEDQAAQDGWVEMWRYTADRYRDNPIVAGYDLMCEPTAMMLSWESGSRTSFIPPTPTPCTTGTSSTRVLPPPFVR